MKRPNYFFGGLLMLASVLNIACSSDEITPGVESKAGKPVSFSTSVVYTRTAYDPANAWSINWVKNDQIRIHSEQCPELHEALYKVDGTTNQGKLVAVDDSRQLKWDEDENTSHTFAAAYPADKATYVSGDKYTFPVPFNQSNADGFMQNAYMVARQTGLKNTLPANSVLMNFTPIMTTFEVTVQGATGNAALTRTITSIQFKTEMPCDGSNNFTYDLTTNTATPSPVEKTITWTPTEDTKTIAAVAGATDTPNKLVFNVFIPYVAISTANPLVITVNFKDENSVDQSYKATLSPSSTINAGFKKKVTLPKLMKEEYPEGITGEHEAYMGVEVLDWMGED